MRDSAVRVVPSAMPNSSVVRTRSCTGSRGGSVPSSDRQRATDRAVERRAYVVTTCVDTCMTISCTIAGDDRHGAAPWCPPAERLPDVLPTERLTASGMPVPEMRAELRRIDDVRNVGSVVLCWAQAGRRSSASAAWIGHPLGYAGGRSCCMGPAFARFAILGHEAAHRLLFPTSGPTTSSAGGCSPTRRFVPFEAYRRSHFAHHKEEFGPNEPDMNLYEGYPITRAASAASCAATPSASRLEEPEAAAAGAALDGRPAGRPAHPRRPGRAAVAVSTLAGRPELYLFLWLAAVDDVVAGASTGCGPSPSTAAWSAAPDRRCTTHHVRQSLARPGSGSCRSTPAGTSPTTSTWACRGATCPVLHGELVAAGWVDARPRVPQLPGAVAGAALPARRLRRSPRASGARAARLRSRAAAGGRRANARRCPGGRAGRTRRTLGVEEVVVADDPAAGHLDDLDGPGLPQAGTDEVVVAEAGGAVDLDGQQAPALAHDALAQKPAGEILRRRPATGPTAASTAPRRRGADRRASGMS